MINWLIEKEMFNENLDALRAEIKKQGFSSKEIRYIPFQNDYEYNIYGEDDCVIVYGSLQFARSVQRNTKWCPGAYCTLENYECVHYYPIFGDYLLNQKYIMVPYGDLVRQKEFLFDTLGESESLFVRPSSGFKLFTGTVIHKEKWEKELNYYDIEPQKVVVVATPQNLIAEWRFIVVGTMVVCGSQYRNEYGTKLTAVIPDEVREYAQDVVDKTGYSPDDVWCLDLCKTKDGNLHVLEVGCFSCAGLYAAPLEPIVREVSQIAIDRWRQEH